MEVAVRVSGTLRFFEPILGCQEGDKKKGGKSNEVGVPG